MGCLYVFDKFIVVVVNGSVVGVGMDLVLCCDFCIVVVLVCFKVGYIGMVYCLDVGVSWYLLWLFGSEVVKCLLFFDEVWSVECVLGVGLVGEVVVDECLVEMVGVFVVCFVSGLIFVFVQIKCLLCDGVGCLLVEQLCVEQVVGLFCGCSEDVVEVLCVVVEKCFF